MKSLVYSDYTNRSLKELINMGVKYVEPSYSYSSIISGINLDSDVNDKIGCRFLLSTDRDRSVKQTKYSLDDLKKALDSNKTVGFDIMGIEEALPLSYTTYGGNQSKSLKRKLELITELFANYPNTNTVLRIHSGETPVSLNNTIWILNALREIKESYDFDIFPPPEIRIGHGVYFQESDLYVQLLREVNATIEINASSNLALGNIPTTNILPYDYYLEHGINVVLFTDGHGLYDTDIRRENFIAQNVSKHFDMLFNIDNEVLENKTSSYEERRGVRR